MQIGLYSFCIFRILILTFSISCSANFIVRIQFTRPGLVKHSKKKLPGSRSRRLPWALMLNDFVVREIGLVYNSEAVRHQVGFPLTRFPPAIGGSPPIAGGKEVKSAIIRWFTPPA